MMDQSPHLDASCPWWVVWEEMSCHVLYSLYRHTCRDIFIMLMLLQIGDIGIEVPSNNVLRSPGLFSNG